MKYAVLTNAPPVGPLITGIVDARPTKVYIVEAETPKKAMNAVKERFHGQAVNVIDAVEADELS